MGRTTPEALIYSNICISSATTVVFGSRTCVDGRGHTSVSEAAAQGHEDILRLLLAEGANPNALNDSGRSGLWRACYNGHIGTLTLLLEAGADASFRDKVWVTGNT